MRLRYREHQFICGQYLETDIYPVWQMTFKNGKRAKKSKPSSETQARLNKRNAERKLIRLLNTNFTPDDIRFDLTYDPAHLPESAEDAAKAMKNFLRRVKYYRSKHDLPELKYVAVTEQGARNKRFHHHIVMNCGDMPVSTLAEIWAKGYTTVKPLQFDEYGIVGIAKYMLKDPILGRRWQASQNLKQPVEKTRDSYISQRKAREIGQHEGDCRSELEQMYKGYTLTECRSFFNEVNSSYYITVVMREAVPRKGRGKKRRTNTRRRT